jgi:hypothetical protein
MCVIVPEFHVSPADVTQLRGRFGGFSVREAEMNPADREWVERYAALRRAFERHHGRLAEGSAAAA